VHIMRIEELFSNKSTNFVMKVTYNMLKMDAKKE